MMQFNRKELLNAVKLASKALPKKALQPVLHCVRVTAADVTATDLDTSIRVNVQSVTDEPAVLVTPGKRFVSVLESISADTVTINVADGTSIINGLSIESFSDDDYPFTGIDREVMDQTAIMEATELQRVFNQTLFAVASYDTSSILGALYLADGNAVATDGSRLSWTKTGMAGEVKALIPGHVISKCILPVLKPLLKKSSEVTISANRSYVQFDGAGFTVLTRQTPGEYPRYTELFPAQSSGKAINLNRKEALAQLKMLKSGVDERTNLLYVDPDDTASNGTDTVSLELGAVGQLQSFAVNYHYFTQALESMTADTAVIEFQAPLKPLVFIDGDYKHLLMPVQSKREPKQARESSAVA